MEKDMRENKDKHEVISRVMKNVAEARKLLYEAGEEMGRYHELSSGWSGGALSEEELKEKKLKAYMNSSGALEDAKIKLEIAMDILAWL